MKLTEKEALVLAKDFSEEETWLEVEALGWSKDCDYERIENEMTEEKATKLFKFCLRQCKILHEHIKSFENLNGKLDINSDDGYRDVIWHIVGLGKCEFEKACHDPRLVEKRYNADEYKESFRYCFFKRGHLRGNLEINNPSQV